MLSLQVVGMKLLGGRVEPVIIYVLAETMLSSRTSMDSAGEGGETAMPTARSTVALSGLSSSEEEELPWIES